MRNPQEIVIVFKMYRFYLQVASVYYLSELVPD